MRHLPKLAPALALLAFGICCGPAAAQVYQCRDAGGNNVFSQTPCGPGASGKKLDVATPPPRADAPAQARDWAAENAAANARAKAGARTSTPAAARRVPDAPYKAGISAEKIIADCEAQRGVRCRNKGEINKRRFEQYEESNLKRQR